MSKKPLILGIETSCDETAASIITENDKGIPTVLSNIVSSQVDVHKEFGGVVPELAARSHIEKIDWIVEKAIADSGKKIEEIDAVASTAGPGLIVCLSVGLSFGKALASAINKPFIAVNHLEGHALSPKLNSHLNYPYLLLLISGGHSQYLSVQGLGKYKRLGTTIDDALGEAFDKTAKLLGIEFPGGPQIEVLAKKGDPGKYDLFLKKRVNGVVSDLAGPVELEVEKIRSGTLSNPMADKHDKYYDDLAEFSTVVTSYQHKFEKANARVKTYQRMLMQITTNIPEASSSLYELTETMNMLEKKVGGSKAKAEIGEKDFLTISDRLSTARGGWYPNSYGPTQLHMQSFDSAKEMFKRVKPEMDAYFENVEKVGKILEEAGAPIVLD